MARIDICTIDLNEGDGRQTIYWDTDDKLLHSDAEPDAETEYHCESIDEAQETAQALWNYPGSPWFLEWIEHE